LALTGLHSTMYGTSHPIPCLFHFIHHIPIIRYGLLCSGYINHNAVRPLYHLDDGRAPRTTTWSWIMTSSTAPTSIPVPERWRWCAEPSVIRHQWWWCCENGHHLLLLVVVCDLGASAVFTSHKSSSPTTNRACLHMVAHDSYYYSNKRKTTDNI